MNRCRCHCLLINCPSESSKVGVSLNGHIDTNHRYGSCFCIDHILRFDFDNLKKSAKKFNVRATYQSIWYLPLKFHWDASAVRILFEFVVLDLSAGDLAVSVLDDYLSDVRAEDAPD